MKILITLLLIGTSSLTAAENVFDRSRDPTWREQVLEGLRLAEAQKEKELAAIKADPKRRNQEIMRATWYSQCILEKMPGVRNDVAAGAARASCASQNPNVRFDIPREKYTGFWADYESANDCTADKAKTAGSESAAYQIRAACNYLYP